MPVTVELSEVFTTVKLDPLTVPGVSASPNVADIALSIATDVAPSSGNSLFAVTVGAVVSMVTLTAVEAELTLPAESVAFAVRLCVASVSVELVILQLPLVAVAVPSDVVPSVSNNSTVLSASAVPLTVGVVSLVELPVVGEVIDGADGAVVSGVLSTVITKLPVFDQFPLESRSCTLNV